MLYAATLPPDAPQMNRLRAVVSGDATDADSVDAVVAAIRESGAIDAALDDAAAFVARAKSRLAIIPDRETRRLLAELADFALTRPS